MALENLCSEIIDEFEGRRRNVNISAIAGSSVCIAGTTLFWAGVFGAPFTAGASLGFIAGGYAMSSLGGATVAGASLYGSALNKEANAKFERYYMNFREQSRVLDDSLVKLQKNIQVPIHIAVSRVVLRAASLVDIVASPSAAVNDICADYFVPSVCKEVIESITKGKVTLRNFRSVLRASRTLLSIMAYGNKMKYF